MKDRSSNIELLRIVAMLMIVFHHVIVHGMAESAHGCNVVMSSLDCLFIFGVNLFVMISGYFTIKLSWKSYLSIIFIMGFYKFFNVCVGSFYLDIDYPAHYWISSPLSAPISASGWFMEVYLMLMLISPLLNKSIENLSKKEYFQGLCLLIIIDCVYSCGLEKLFDACGYSLMHFVVMYYLAFGLKKYIKISNRFAVIALLISLIISILTVVMQVPLKISSYANPLVMISSVCIFVLFANNNLKQNIIINRIAMSMLPIYLISDCSEIGFRYYRTIAWWYDTLSVPDFIFHIFLYVGVLFVLVFLIDCVRILIQPFIVNPLAHWLSKATLRITSKL